MDDMAENVPVDDQGRLRIPATHLKWAGLTEKSVKAQLLPARADGWLELYSEPTFDEMLLSPIDPWREAYDRLVRRRREEQSNEQ